MVSVPFRSVPYSLTHVFLVLPFVFVFVFTEQDLGMNTDGGFGQVISVPSDWIVAPNPFACGATTGSDESNNEQPAAAAAVEAARVSMVYGTAGLTAALCVTKLLEQGMASPSDGRVLVTGASGGVGSISVEILANLGFTVVAVSGKASSSETKLMELGAAEVVVSAIVCHVVSCYVVVGGAISIIANLVFVCCVCLAISSHFMIVFDFIVFYSIPLYSIPFHSNLIQILVLLQRKNI